MHAGNVSAPGRSERVHETQAGGVVGFAAVDLVLGDVVRESTELCRVG